MAQASSAAAKAARHSCTQHVMCRPTATPAAPTSGQPGLADLLTESSWKVHLDGEFQKPYFQKLEKYLQSEWATQQIFPPKDAIFRSANFPLGARMLRNTQSMLLQPLCAKQMCCRYTVKRKLILLQTRNIIVIMLCRAFNSCSFDDVKVVVLGQDPYHNVNQAMGLSFSVPPGQPVPSSLKNMYRELATDCACTVPKHGNLIKVYHAGPYQWLCMQVLSSCGRKVYAHYGLPADAKHILGIPYTNSRCQHALTDIQ